MRKSLFAAALLAAFVVSAPGSAQTLNFDDIASSGNSGNTVYVPQLYHGYTFGGTNTSANFCGGSGQCDWVTNLDFWNGNFPTAASSPTHAWSNAVGVLTLSRAVAFNFTSAAVGARYGFCGVNLPITMTVNGYLGASLVQSSTRTLSCSSFAVETFNFNNVDKVEFLATNLDANRVIDDVVLSDAAVVTPEPVSIVLVGAGLLGIGVAARRRRSVI